MKNIQTGSGGGSGQNILRVEKGQQKKWGSSVDLLHGSILKSLLLFALPLLISNAFQQLYNAMDTMIVGRFLGEESLAAIGASAAVYELLVGFALGVGNGLSIVAARSYGSQDTRLLKKSVAGSLVIGVGMTVVLMIASQLFLYPLLKLLGTPASILEESYSYIGWITRYIGVMFAYNLLSGLLRAIGNSVMPLVFLVISSVLNVFLDLLFITRFGMGIRGAAVATVIAQGISALLCLIYILVRCSILIPKKEHFSIPLSLYGELLGQGLSMGLMVGIVSIGTVILQVGINQLGDMIIAGHVAARKVQSLANMPFVAIGLAASTFVSQNRGADNRDRIRKAVRISNGIAGAWGLFIVLVMALGAEEIIRLLSGSDNPDLLGYATSYLRISSYFYVILGILLNTRNSIQGLGRKLVPLVSSIMELIGKILFVIFLIPRLGAFGVIICEPVIWIFMCIQLLWAFYTDSYIRGKSSVE